jgi:hypothetical protein
MDDEINIIKKINFKELTKLPKKQKTISVK